MEEQTDRPTECDSCGFEGVPLNRFDYSFGPLMGEVRWLCDVCSSTYVGRVDEFPRQYENIPLYKSLAIATNMILQRIDEMERNIIEIRELLNELDQ